MKSKLASILAAAKKRNSKVGSEGRSNKSRGEKSDSDAIDRMADLKVSNPLFVGAKKLTDHSFIRHVKAESQCHPKTPFNGKGKSIFFGKDQSVLKLTEENDTPLRQNTLVLKNNLIRAAPLIEVDDSDPNNFLR